MFEKEAEFEKEAKEYSIENYETCLYDDFPYTNDARAREQSFKDGAEFGYNKANEELKKENAELKEQVENRNCSNCRRSKAGCPNDGSCHNFSLWQPFINPKLAKAKELIGELKSSLSVVGECELLNRAEQFLREI